MRKRQRFEFFFPRNMGLQLIGLCFKVPENVSGKKLSTSYPQATFPHKAISFEAKVLLVFLKSYPQGSFKKSYPQGKTSYPQCIHRLSTGYPQDVSPYKSMVYDFLLYIFRPFFYPLLLLVLYIIIDSS